MEHKFTDDEIVKAYEACLCVNCRICPLAGVYDCGSRVEIGIPEIYNRQKEEIERLTINMNAFGLGMKREKERADNAIKEFAERLKERKCHYTETEHTFDFDGVDVDEIDNLVKEMTEEGTE